MAKTEAPMGATVLISLRHPVKDAGAELPALTMRRPKVKDQLAVQKMNASEAEREVRLFANLCEVSPEAIGDLTLGDYRRVQDAYRGFMEEAGED